LSSTRLRVPARSAFFEWRLGLHINPGLGIAGKEFTGRFRQGVSQITPNRARCRAALDSPSRFGELGQIAEGRMVALSNGFGRVSALGQLSIIIAELGLEMRFLICARS
jgi:hypothetical protein